MELWKSLIRGIAQDLRVECQCLTGTYLREVPNF